MTYSATIKGKGILENTWIITPIYTRVDGKNAPDLTAISADGIVPQINDIVLCTESINDIDHNSARSYDDNRGANPVIIGVFSQLYTTKCDVTIQGKATLGTGSMKMVRGEDLATWAQAVDTALQIIQAAAGSDVVPAITASSWQSTNLSSNHRLD